MQHHETVWVVVEVWRGIPAGVEIFRSREKAVDYENRLRARLNTLEDETDLFEVELESPVAHSESSENFSPPSLSPDLSSYCARA
jgi:hypothetical protein